MTVCVTVFMMKVVVLLALLTLAGGDVVVGRAGGGVTLPCKYDIIYHGSLAVCWGRGELPTMGCGDRLVSTDGHRVVEGTRASSRYQLLGRLEDGDASLTILNVSETDAGRYGCRVEVSGWFNDHKHHVDLVIDSAPEATTSSALTRETSSEQTDVSRPAGQLTSTQRLLTSSSGGVTAEDSSSVKVVLVNVLFGLVALVTAGAIIIIASRRRRLNKTREQQVNSWVQFRSPSSSRGPAVENIYQIDDGGDGGEYEYCP